MRMGQQADEAPEDLFPLDTFLENAEKRVKLDLLFSEFVKFFKLEVNQERVDEFVDKEAEKYKDELLNKFQRHDLSLLSLKKPGLIEKRVNNATKKVFDDIERLTAIDSD